LIGFGSKASSLVCRLESLRISLKPRTLRDHNGIEEGGTRREARPAARLSELLPCHWKVRHNHAAVAV